MRAAIDAALGVISAAGAAQPHPGILVSYSGGKDSLAVLDLCAQVVQPPALRAFFMYFLPGAAAYEPWLEFARRRYGVEITQYPHPALAACIRKAIYCDPIAALDDLPDLRERHVYAAARADAGIDVIATGRRRADSVLRRGRFARRADPRVVAPIAGWNRYEVAAYLRGRAIPMPEAAGRDGKGLDLRASSLFWLHDRCPADFARLCEYFPYAQAVIERRKRFGA